MRKFSTPTIKIRLQHYPAVPPLSPSLSLPVIEPTMQAQQRPLAVDNSAPNVPVALPGPLVQRLAGNVAHELNQLLTLLTHATASLRDHEVGHEDDLETLMEVCARAELLAKSLLHVSGRPLPATPPPQKTQKLDHNSASVLVVDDEPRVRRLVARSLRKAGYLVDEVQTPKAALKVLERERFDVLVTDVLMPEMNGSELAFKALCLRPGLRVMFMTGYVEDTGIGTRELPDSMEVLAKPFGPAELIERVTGLVQRSLPSQLTLKL